MNNGILIQGDNVHVYRYDDEGHPFEIVCAETMELLKEVELIGATTPESEGSPEVRPRLVRVSLSLTGVSTSTNDSDVSIFYLSQNIRAVHDLLIVFTDNNGNERTFRQDFYIEPLSITGNAGESSDYSVKFRGSGNYIESELEDPVVTGESILSASYVVSGGKITDARWDGLSEDNIIEVCREGSEQLSLGLPFTFDESTTSITPDPGTTIDGQRMFVIWTY